MKITYEQAEAIGTAKTYKVLDELTEQMSRGETVTTAEKKSALDILVRVVSDLTGKSIDEGIVQQIEDSVEYFTNSTASVRDKHLSILLELKEDMLNNRYKL